MCTSVCTLTQTHRLTHTFPSWIPDTSPVPPLPPPSSLFPAGALPTPNPALLTSAGTGPGAGWVSIALTLNKEETLGWQSGSVQGSSSALTFPQPPGHSGPLLQPHLSSLIILEGPLIPSHPHVGTRPLKYRFAERRILVLEVSYRWGN